MITHEYDLEYISHLEYLKAATHGMIQITVTDTGIGIQEKDQGKLF